MRPCSERSTDSTASPRWNSTPISSSLDCASLTTRLSLPGSTVLHELDDGHLARRTRRTRTANSRPMTPPPMMTISRGMLGQRGRLVARPDAGHRVVDVGELEDDRAGREDDGVALDDLRAALGQVDDELVGADQLALAVDDVDLEPLGARLDLADELVDDALLAGAQRRRCRPSRPTRSARTRPPRRCP